MCLNRREHQLPRLRELGCRHVSKEAVEVVRVFGDDGGDDGERVVLRGGWRGGRGETSCSADKSERHDSKEHVLPKSTWTHDHQSAV